MKFFRPLICGLAITATVAAQSAPAKNATNLFPVVDMQKTMQRMAPKAQPFDANRLQTVEKMNAKMDLKRQNAAPIIETGVSPVMTLGPSSFFYDLDGPNGELWYCTGELKTMAIKHQWYDELILTEYSYTIYDEKFQEVGTIHDKMRYADDEVRVPGPESGISLLPIVTRNFFNNDDKCEIVVSLAVNTTTPGVNRYRSVIYSLGGEKEKTTVIRNGDEVEIEADVPVMTLNGFIGDVLNASTAGEENYYMTMMHEFGAHEDIDFDALMDGDEEEGKKYWGAMSTNGYRFVTYGKANDKGDLVKVFEKSVSYQTMQGDQESTPLIVTLTHDGKPYILLPHYKDTFFNPYYSPLADMTMREENELVIDLYELKGYEYEKVCTTEIPVKKVNGRSVLATYYSVGDFSYARDIDFDDNGKPVYIVTRCNYTTISDETSGFCYYKYDSEGNLLYTIFENAESNVVLSDVPGHDRQGLFVIYDDEAGYVYNFVDLSKGYGDDTVKINYLLDTGYDEPEVLSFNVDRVQVGKNYKYAFEMRAPLVDEYDNNFMRVAWFKADGSFDRIDHINMGKAVNYATTYINGVVLKNDFILSDDEYEYMVLIKRGLSGETSQSQEELIIGQPVDENLEGGATVLYLKPCEKGALNHISVYPGRTDDTYRLFIGYSDEEYYTADFYNLPFDSTAIEELPADKTVAPLAFDGKTVYAQGEYIKVYTAAGALVATGIDNLNVDTLPAGLYVAVAGKKVGKFLVK